jgi:hypothetical protein
MNKISNYSVLTPAYGRDYASSKAAKQAFMAGRDWLLQPSGKPCSVRDFAPGVGVELRFSKLRNLTIVKV